MLDTLTTFAATATTSDFFAGGLALGVFGLAVGLTRNVWRRGFDLVARRLSVTVTVDNRVAEYRHLLNGLEAAGAFARVRRFRLTWTGGRGARVAAFAPAMGTFWFRQGRQIVRFSRSMNDKARAGNSGTPLESLTLMLPFGSKDTVQGWIDAGKAKEDARHKIGPVLYRYGDGYWHSSGQILKRPVASLVAEDDRIERLLEDVRWFYDAKDWYVARSVPWRRGYLLHGPPGTGKSSVIRAIASELGLGLAVLDVGRRTLTDDALCDALAQAPADTVLVFEDIDAVFTARDRDDGVGVSFSGLLNALDGIAAQEGRALFMTTNHVDQLDPALIRPGRADMHVELGHVGADAARALFLRFFEGETALADRFAARIGDARLAPAALQGWLLANASDAGVAADARGLVPVREIAAE